MRGPYETSLNEFAECVCTILEEGETYTYYEAREKCGISYRTVKDYATLGLHDVNLRIVKECGRSVQSEKVRRDHPGLRVYPLPDGSLHSDLCTTELGIEPAKKQYIPRDLPPKHLYLLRDIAVPRLSAGKHAKGTFHVTPFLAM